MRFYIKKVDRNNERDYREWKNFLKVANGGTIFHDPDFLSYHWEKFDEHHLGFYKGESLYGFIPMALVEENGRKIAKSPYGASYGGFIWRKVLSYEESKEAINIFLEYIHKLGVSEVLITPSLGIYHLDGYSETFNFCLLEAGFKLINSDITSVVSLNECDRNNKIYKTKVNDLRREAKKALKFGVHVKHKADIDDFWEVLEKSFDKHKTKPTHTKAEFSYLNKIFPERIYCNVAYYKDIPISGIALFELNRKTLMSFYICSDEDYRDTQALSLLLYETFMFAEKMKYDYFDFGTSSAGMKARPNVFKYKEVRGAVGVFKNTYALKF